MNGSFMEREEMFMYKEDFIEEFENIECEDREGLFGFAVMEMEYDDNYSDIGYSLLNIIENADKYTLKIIEETLLAITGYDLEHLLDKMKRNEEYYDSL